MTTQGLPRIIITAEAYRGWQLRRSRLILTPMTGWTGGGRVGGYSPGIAYPYAEKRRLIYDLQM